MPRRGYSTIVVLLLMFLWHGTCPALSYGQQGAAAPPPNPNASADLNVGSGPNSRVWARASAIEFGFDQLAKLIDYVFLAALAMLGLVVKTCVFDRMNANPAPALFTRTEYALVVAAICLLALSAIFGLFAYGYLPLIMTASSFSLNDMIGYLVLGQEVTCGAGMISIGILCFVRLHRH